MTTREELAVWPRNHYECPNDCGEHPQPFEVPMPYNTSIWLCGRCWFEFHVVSICVPCTPEIC